jgi:hypothetical protein
MRLFNQGVRDRWFCLPVLYCMLLDAGFTLGCQPAEYWRDAARLQEGNAAWEALLARGPAVFVVGFLFYCAVMTALLLWIRGSLQKLLGMFVILAHSYGAATWCHVALPEGAYWYGLLGVLLSEALVFAIYWRLMSARTATGRDAPAV